jgi:uncharacterized membrane protein
MHRSSTVPAPPRASLGERWLPASAWEAVSLLVCLAAVTVAGWHLFTPYSYWLDELFSVNLSRLPIREMHAVLLNDVHPPLYQVLLKLWMKMAGPSEPATRLFSALCAMAAVGLLWRHARGWGPVFLVSAVTLLASSKLLIFYSNETRGYALALLCSMAVTLSAPRTRQQPAGALFALSCLALSLTHYFGLIYVGAMLAVCLQQALPNRVAVGRLIMIGLGCLAWPAHHLLHGAVLAKTGGAFWITVRGVQDSLSIAGTALSPVWSAPLGTQDSASSAAGPVLVLCILLAMGRIRACRTSSHPATSELAQLALRMGAICLLFLVAIALIDLHTPMSTVRNFIILLPPLVLLGAGSLSVIGTAQPGLLKPLMVGLGIVCSVSMWTAREGVAMKSTPRQDWKSAVTALAPHAATRTVRVGTYGMIVDHYFREHALDPARALPWKEGQSAITEPSVLIYGHLDPPQYARLLGQMRALGARRIHPAHEPEDGFEPGVYLVH